MGLPHRGQYAEVDAGIPAGATGAGEPGLEEAESAFGPAETVAM